MNIILYSESSSSKIADLINIDDEVQLRQFDLSELENYKQYSPSLLILDFDINKVREFCAVRKLECPTLIIADEIPESLTVRALSYDYIKNPIDKNELNVRIRALLKTFETKSPLIKPSVSIAKLK